MALKIAESKKNFWQDPDIIKAIEWSKEAKIAQVIDLITKTFSEYSISITKYQEKYKDQPDRIDVRLKVLYLDLNKLLIFYLWMLYQIIKILKI